MSYGWPVIIVPPDFGWAVATKAGTGAAEVPDALETPAVLGAATGAPGAPHAASRPRVAPDAKSFSAIRRLRLASAAVFEFMDLLPRRVLLDAPPPRLLARIQTTWIEPVAQSIRQVVQSQ